MHFSTIALIATTAAAAETFNLQIVSDDSELNGSGIQGLHEGAGISYFGVSGQLGQEFEYDAEKKTLHQEQGTFTANVGTSGNYFAVGPAITPSEVTFDDEGKFDIGQQLWACKNLTDPYRYFTDSYGVVVGESANDSCVKIGLQRVDEATVEESASPSEASSSEVPAAPSSARAGWNTTVTDHVTVTGFTTYCPIPTTLTVTTCENQACGPKTITVSEPKTVTVTEECIVPKPSSAPASEAPATSHPEEVTSAPESTTPAPSPKPTTPTTIASVSTSAPAPSSAPGVSSFEGVAAKNAAGAALGFAGVAALLI
ncbi:hypothetical protein FT663_03505 [Candidozyma haemuli var. vulneris]|uniref:Uncharacterized protein n=1 Tax=Candidozyma haemuli TaxID=45357 RepID=A0A2V1AX15_9ASCO|nr:hypothetical protein CXQ85_004557 [[Candida] haemuloni]KAF3987966.1 hypothetical protein FT662_03680 [[Candida] haemuloni var. vulneris]KAF3989736.1 hypothetical protein FT663_03505 [[Candida] haemuloni var. vulneris]PVH21893.1 hypothetical protein CXQ85_004557 [[Candida] haemuloni]